MLYHIFIFVIAQSLLYTFAFIVLQWLVSTLGLLLADDIGKIDIDAL